MIEKQKNKITVFGEKFHNYNKLILISNKSLEMCMSILQ